VHRIAMTSTVAGGIDFVAGGKSFCEKLDELLDFCERIFIG